jgi:hypothetical protein
LLVMIKVTFKMTGNQVCIVFKNPLLALNCVILQPL